ncbi:unnamed protein product [Zymoseptoria tritici ST99CH_1A5]|uniref:Uncharacterized protein n=1 Tax=Zymoseptoria tritici ST99CH_1A5 TaxID=1276529 RepID=A0A1Y6LX04_ZYMTR|nr:unnamed protein product [Zymoseptoria tritici ST99CH_1A5]
MAPKGKQQNNAAAGGFPPWYDGDLVKLFYSMHKRGRRDHQILTNTTEPFVGLLHHLDRLSLARDVAKGGSLGFGGNVLDPNMVLSLVMNQHVAQSTGPGLFLHWWGSYDHGGQLPAYFMLRSWSEPERKQYLSQYPLEQLQICNGSLTWALASFLSQAAGVVLLMPNRVKGGTEIIFQYIDYGVGMEHFGLFYHNKSLVFVKLQDVANKEGKDIPVYLKTQSKTYTTHQWRFGSADAADAWMQSRLLQTPVEEDLMAKLQEAFWDEDSAFKQWEKISDVVSGRKAL